MGPEEEKALEGELELDIFQLHRPVDFKIAHPLKHLLNFKRSQKPSLIMADELKAKGNAAIQAKNFDEAV